jgi:NAD(P)-dependent dehydrogenase (short-subunit alcohol dehydrogenase family)
MKLKDSVVLITGANRGIGLAFAKAAMARGARRVYAGARDPSQINGLRNELKKQNTQVLAMHMGFVDTDLTKGIDMPKESPESVVNRAFDALEANLSEVLADASARR